MSFTSNPVYVLVVLCLMVILSVYASQTKYGKPLGAALLVILFTAIVANFKFIPSASNSIPLYDAIFTYVAPISIFFLLLNVSLRSIKQAGLPMVSLFLIGSLTTALGVLLSWVILKPESVLGDEAKIIAGMFTGTYTGGSVNFNAVALEYDFQKNGILYAGTIAVDNVITTLWMIITLLIPMVMNRIWKGKTVVNTQKEGDVLAHPEDEGMDLNALMWLVFLGISAFYISDLLSDLFPKIPAILILSTIGIVLAQIRFIANLKGSHQLGLFLVYIFLAVIGAYCEIGAVSQLEHIGIMLLLFAGLAVLLHGILLILISGLLYRDWEIVAIVSQANVGGGTSAIALAEAFKRKDLILPAILVGSLGNALGTYLGFLVVYML